jgi:flagellin
MSTVIFTNTAALSAQRNLSRSQSNATTSIQRLSSGLRINSAADDAAGLGVSENLKAQIVGNNQAARNANDAISMLQSAEGGLQETSSLLQRMRELATQGNNDSLSDAQKNYIGAEIKGLREEMNKVATRTTFNGKTLLDGSVSNNNGFSGTVQFQTGVSEHDKVDISVLMVDARVDGGSMGVDNADDSPMSLLVGTPASLGGFAPGSPSTMGDVMGMLGLAIDAAAGTDVGVALAKPSSSAFGTLTTAVDIAVAAVASARAAMGSVANVLDHNIANLQSQSDNLTAAKSRITDTDYAMETAQMSKNQIMQQAATAMLSQANQMPNVVMTLLKQ